MKLLNCLKCHDIVELAYQVTRVCKCGESSGKYIDELYAEYSGHCRILGISNKDYVRSIQEKTTLDSRGNSTPRFEWFVILEGQHIKKLR